MKWSDGQPFTADDFMFWYEDLLQNTDLNPEIDPTYMPGGTLMGLKKVDDTTLEFSFAEPNPRAVETIVNSDEIFRPKHFLSQYLPKYNPDADALAKTEGLDSWQLALEFHTSYNADPSYPTLLPWIIKDIGADSALWVRNPFYWRVDTDGNQLPYIDSLLVTIASDPNSTNPVKVMAGEVDWEIMGMTIEDYPVIKGAEAQGEYKAYLWPDNATSTALGFALNYTHQDPELRTIFNDLRFRQALSLAIDRDDINQTIFFGKTEPFVAPVSRDWTGFEDWMATYYAEHDVDKANQLLDEMGLQWDAAHQWRLKPDGQPISILGEQTVDYLSYAMDLLGIVAKNWADIGIQFEPKFVPGDVLMPRYVANEQDIGIWNSDGGTEAAARRRGPIRLQPPWHHMGIDCCAMSSYPWRQWLDTNGAAGEEPPQEIKDLHDLVKRPRRLHRRGRRTVSRRRFFEQGQSTASDGRTIPCSQTRCWRRSSHRRLRPATILNLLKSRRRKKPLAVRVDRCTARSTVRWAWAWQERCCSFPPSMRHGRMQISARSLPRVWAVIMSCHEHARQVQMRCAAQQGNCAYQSYRGRRRV